MKILVLGLLVLAAPASAHAVAASFAERLPRNVPSVLYNAGRNIDQALANAERDAAECSTLKTLPTNLAYIGVGLAVDRTPEIQFEFASLNVAVVKALGGCLTSDLLGPNAKPYIKSKLEDAGNSLLAMASLMDY